MKKSLIELIKEPIPDRNYSRSKWRFWPSEASCIVNGKPIGKCLRCTYYKWKNLPETNPVDDLVKMLGGIGCFVEYQTRKDLVAKKAYSLESNKKENRKFRVNVADDITLSGEVDIIAGNTQEWPEHCGIEVKSYSNSTHQLMNRPKDPHLLQTFLYVVYYKPVQPYFVIRYLPSMVFKYATRPVHHRIDSVEIDGEIHPVINGVVDKNIKISSIIRRFKESKYYITNSKLPKREFKLSSTNCKYCAYKDFCKTDKDGESINEE